MGFDIFFVNQVGEEWQEAEDADADAERLASVGEFLNLAQTLTIVTEPLHALDDPAILGPLAAAFETIAEGRAGKIAKFDDYCAYINQAYREILSTQAVEPGAEWSEVDPAEFHPEARAFLGGFMLADAPISPDNYLAHMPYISASLALLRIYADELEGRNMAEQAAALRDAYQSLDIARKFGDRAVAENRHFNISG